MAGKNKLVFHSFLVIKINPNYSPPTQHTESHNLLSLPLGEVRRLTGSLCGKSHLLFESKQPFPHPQTQSLRLPLSSKMSWVTDAYPEPIEKRWGNEAKRNQFSRCAKTKQRPVFSVARFSPHPVFFNFFEGCWKSAAFCSSKRKQQNMSCYLLLNSWSSDRYFQRTETGIQFFLTWCCLS